MFRFKVLLVILATACILTNCQAILSSNPPEVTVTTSVQNRSLFAGDTCAPPCWFGLTPGVSTYVDVVEMFDSNGNTFGVNQQDSVDGESIAFLWREWNKPAARVNNYVYTEARIVTQIVLETNETISLQDVLNTFNNPTYIRGSIEVPLILDFFYTDHNLIVSLFAERFDCDSSNWTLNFKAMSLRYYTQTTFEELNQRFEEDMLIPENVWNAWLRGEMTGSCEDALWEIYRATSTATPNP